MPRFKSWLAIAVASALLVVATAAFSLRAITALAFALSIDALLVSSAVADYRGVFPAGGVRSGVHARLAQRQHVQRIAASYLSCLRAL